MLQYFVKWKGYPESDNTWEPAQNIHAPDLLKKYHQRYPLTDKRGGTAKKKVSLRTQVVTTCLLMPLTSPLPILPMSYLSPPLHTMTRSHSLPDSPSMSRGK